MLCCSCEDCGSCRAWTVVPHPIPPTHPPTHSLLPPCLPVLQDKLDKRSKADLLRDVGRALLVGRVASRGSVEYILHAR